MLDIKLKTHYLNSRNSNKNSKGSGLLRIKVKTIASLNMKIKVLGLKARVITGCKQKIYDPHTTIASLSMKIEIDKKKKNTWLMHKNT